MTEPWIKFLEGLSDMELVALLKEARERDDKETVDAILIILGERQKAAL